MAAEPSGEFAPAVPFLSKSAAGGEFGFFCIGVEGLKKIVVEISDFGFRQPVMRRYDVLDFFRQGREKRQIFVSLRGDQFH